MSQFELYLKMGFEHIADVQAYDHIVFLIALCAIYSLKSWKKVLILVTAFTIGHSLTLGLAVFDLIRFSPDVIETLIPVTILLTCAYNVMFHRENASPKVEYWHYGLALGFGLIHGMGFSNYLRSMMMPGESIFQQLLAFNIGVELGQILIVLIILVVSFVLLELLNVKKREWNLFVSGAAAGIAVTLLL